MFSIDTTPRYNTIDREYWQSEHTDWWYHKDRDFGTQGITPLAFEECRPRNIWDHKVIFRVQDCYNTFKLWSCYV